MDIFSSFKNYAFNSIGFRTNKKIIVIESDDWGSIRTSSLEAYQELSRKLPHLIKDPYTKYDALEDSDDLLALFEILDSVRDQNNNPAILTANTIVANPDFEAIQAGGFKNYFYETIDTTLSKRDNNKVIGFYKEGISKNIFFPQLHGREHLNVNHWMKALQIGHQELLMAFEFGMFGIPLSKPFNFKKNVMAAWDFSDPKEINDHGIIIDEAQLIFENLFGYKSSTIIAPSYVWHPLHESYFLRNGIVATQGLPYQFIPNPKGNWYKKKFRYTSGKNELISLVRNAFFEPSLQISNAGIVDECLRRIEIAFKMKKPAIIGSHRINFIGSLDKSNRENNLRLFKELLNKIVQKWGDVEFMSSDQLVSTIKEG